MTIAVEFEDSFDMNDATARGKLVVLEPLSGEDAARFAPMQASRDRPRSGQLAPELAGGASSTAMSACHRPDPRSAAYVLRGAMLTLQSPDMIRFQVVMMSVLAAVTGCGRAAVDPQLDGGTDPRDAARNDDAPADGTAPAAYSHAITIDGTDDFVAAETFTTTSASYTAKLSWDSEHLYLGYAGPDLDPAAPQTATKWLFAYIDLDPGAATGANLSQLYRTQRAAFPTGFGAETYVRWKCDASLVSLEQHQAGDTWTTAVTPAFARAGTFVELAIPRALLGPATSIGVVTWMINEQDGVEGSYAGLYAGNFTDGYVPSLPITKYLKIDFAAARAPNDPANQAP